ncbi:MAG: LytR/AlgR family response regulator transcription factor [Caulobacteraceae bacterium]
MIADDEPLSLRRLELGLGYVPGVQLVGSARNAAGARDLIRNERPDLALLDIGMPGSDGLELAAEFVGKGPTEVIFVTAHCQFAVRAFDLAVTDYLLKPLDFDRLRDAIVRARERILARDSSALLAEAIAQSESLRAMTATHAYERELWIHERHGRVRVPLHQVVWFEAERDYVRVHTSERSYLMRRPLQDLADHLDSGQFLRLHRSALVNSGKIARLVRDTRGALAVSLVTGVEVRIGRKYQKAVRDHLGI